MDHAQDDMPDTVAASPSDSEPDDASSNADSTDDEPQVQSLVAGREKRRNAGNRMATAIAHDGPADADEDEELNAIFAEGLDDAEFQDADPVNDDDDDDDSSSDDEDKPGAEDDLEGEKELKKQERAEQHAQKRKAGRGMPIPLKKRVKIQAPPETDEERRRRRKKSDRVSWVPSEADQPTRVSSRTLSVQNKTRTLASIKESSRRAQETREKMRKSEAKKKALEKPPMTQADRLAEAARMEKVNAKSVHRWEEQEQERLQRQREELERLRNKKIEGPVIRWYSGPAEWAEHWDNKELRHYSKVEKLAREEQLTPLDTREKTPPEQRDTGERPAGENGKLVQPNTDIEFAVKEEQSAPPSLPEVAEHAALPPAQPSGDGVGKAVDVSHSANPAALPPDESMHDEGLIQGSHSDLPSFLAGIEDFAAMDSSQPTSERQPAAANMPEVLDPVMSTESSNAAVLASPAPTITTTAHSSEQVSNHSVPQPPRPHIEPAAQGPGPTDDDAHTESHTADSLLASFSPRTGDAASSAPAALHPLVSVLKHQSIAPIPPKSIDKAIKYHTGQAQTISLINFSDTLNKQPDAIRRIIYGSQYVPPEKGKASEKNKKGPNCVITSHSARYRDPTTGLPYAGKESFQILRRLIRGAERAHSNDVTEISDLNESKDNEKPIRWSTLLSAWVGKEGLAAGGVPQGFLHGTIPLRVEEPPKQVDAVKGAEGGSSGTLSNAASAAPVVKAEIAA